MNQSPSKYDYKHIFHIPGFPSNPEESHKKAHLLLTSVVSRLNSGCACVHEDNREFALQRNTRTHTKNLERQAIPGWGWAMRVYGKKASFMSAECSSVWPLGLSEALQEFM